MSSVAQTLVPWANLPASSEAEHGIRPRLWTDDPRLVVIHDRYLWYAIHVDRSIKAARAGIPKARLEARLDKLYNEAKGEIVDNPATYPRLDDCPRDDAGKATWWRKCDAVCDFPAEQFVQTRTKKEHMIQWLIASMAMSVICSCELDTRTVHDHLLRHAETEVLKLCEPELYAQYIEHSARALAEPDLFLWVGESFCDRDTGLVQHVEDAGHSIALGEYFVLRTEGGEQRQVSREDFKAMVDGLELPEHVDEY
ncbi:hypothetical protein FA95DRAFT_1605963 [Auriscalpium vulgare]|uniref:Uncharacterized protein n=1 Tax=Auriscalpium vulgare TaxID=40419 RepID=A0ACB8RTS5_9AGAM|nr:hypothetical protein FA95DRAFT_1605963 [Auriscalpium vulgare]